ncbi:hypothetical protein [Bacillus weihaiensis]|uniref:Uncharacterized protein n=1 Tax=Bacillus weihaiensis TaxID=1547283 RepID=A0A1L3MNF5_9BACI|nr:hypothetical protein [Bacillus weihaiensis]APH03875.1 hypothetical protein A9C19_03360 [Bacillus weihaiensis]
MEHFIQIMGLFLYFPEDKKEYIPAAITMLVFFVAAVFVFMFIVKQSKKEATEVEKQMKVKTGDKHKSNE